MYSTLIEALEQYIVLDRDETKLVAEYVQERSYEKGDFILKTPNVCTEIGFALLGVLRYYYIDEEGSEMTDMFMQEGDFFTDLESFRNKTPSNGYIQALSKAEVLIFDTRTHKALRKRITGWDRAFNQIAEERLLNQLTFSRSLVKDDALDAYKRFLATYPAIAARVSNLHLASFSGISRYTLSRIKSQIEKE